MPVDKLGFNINDWVVDTISDLARMQHQIGELQRQVALLMQNVQNPRLHPTCLDARDSEITVGDASG